MEHKMVPVTSGTAGKARAEIIRACQKHWHLHAGDCSGFLKAVVAELRVKHSNLGSLSGQANDIHNAIQRSPWTLISGTGREGWMNAATLAVNQGYLVVGAWYNPDGNGHLAIVTGYSDESARALAYWGSLGGAGSQAGKVTESWGKDKIGSVIYAYQPLR